LTCDFWAKYEEKTCKYQKQQQILSGQRSKNGKKAGQAPETFLIHKFEATVQQAGR
jgi:hypothetical protein